MSFFYVVAIVKFYVGFPQILQKSESRPPPPPQFVDARSMTSTKFHTEAPRFDSDLWTSLLSGNLGLMHVC
jgi:hypothetical protein